MNIWRVPYPKFGDSPGLDRVRAVAARLGIDLRAFSEKAVAVIGSNGKGSTAAMAAALIAQTNPDVGLFTSPHLLDLSERFRIGDDDITDAELVRHWRRVMDAVEACRLGAATGGFEFLFLIAADWFAARGCAHTVWEAGLGGRLDPIRLIEAKHTVLTSIDFEHTALLGETREAIALEKIAAVARGHALAIGDSVAGDAIVRAAIERWCEANAVVLSITSPLADAPLAGAHQRSNAALALWLAQEQVQLNGEQIHAGFAFTRWPGRLEVLSADPLEVIDVGHTPDGVAAALEGFESMRGARPAVLVCGVSHDKEASAILARLAPAFSDIICAAAHHKGAPAANIAAHAQAANSTAEITLAESVIDARRLALAKAEGGAIYVAGGLFLVAEYKAAHLGRDPASLVFF
ncbi:MAG: folylpolyglutamate synthase/dihydrofolate synthase family protein [Hyphomonadaceae bacterium]